jgi:hypothetical protein
MIMSLILFIFVFVIPFILKDTITEFLSKEMK